MAPVGPVLTWPHDQDLWYVIALIHLAPALESHESRDIFGASQNWCPGTIPWCPCLD